MKIQSRDNGLPQCGSVTSKGPTCTESNTMAFGGGGEGLYCEVNQQGEEGGVKSVYSIQDWGKI